MVYMVIYVVAHGRAVTSSRQITEVKQRRAQFSTWMGDRCSSHAGGHVYRCWASLSYHAASVHPAVMGTWWKEQWRIVNGNSCRKCAEFSPEEMDSIRESSNTRGVNCEIC